MPRSLRAISVAGLALVAAFYAFFMFTKHDPTISAIIPFGSDPYDSVGSFALVISALLAVLSLVRAFRPRAPEPAPATGEVFLARTLIAIAFAVLIALAADVIAMARHVAMWWGAVGASELVALIIGMALLSLGFVFVVRRAVKTIDLPIIPTPWLRLSVTCLVFIVVLALYPEGIIGSMFGELLSLAAGILLLFVPLSVLTAVLVPYETGDAVAGAGEAGVLSRPWVQWAAAALLGISIGAVLLLGEVVAGEGGGGNAVPLAQRVVVASVFVGAGAVGMLVAYYSLRKPLGLFRR